MPGVYMYMCGSSFTTVYFMMYALDWVYYGLRAVLVRIHPEALNYYREECWLL